ncbi:MAG: hypothetical protein ACR2OI_03685 [Acidimicrobiia bacterium]
MGVIWGLIVVALSLLCWGGQTLSTVAPATANRLTLMEGEADVEPTFWADIRGEAAWDSLTLWTMVVAGVLLMLDNPAWAYFGLVGGGMYVYFAGRGIFTRIVMQGDGLRIGAAANRTVGYAMLVVWGVMALITMAAAVVALAA